MLLNKILFKQIFKLPISINKLLINTRKQLQLKISEFYFKALLRLLLSNAYDFNFACAIQMAYYPVERIIFYQQIII
ncbi:unnamed protein product [Paramecium pentaurelia]|uniref:Uncharacterized protein n=1 Tax=Paramecium pentaurelia TaxID=43138 RepID=A0A8S1Y6Q2_9CILI|nr:unnamed protein product [Paramecium pentaurelia]